MRKMSVVVTRASMSLFLVVVINACAGSTGSDKEPDELHCPGTQMIVCTGGSESRIRTHGRSDQRFCNCKNNGCRRF